MITVMRATLTKDFLFVNGKQRDRDRKTRINSLKLESNGFGAFSLGICCAASFGCLIASIPGCIVIDHIVISRA
jgi:hypothetical protein